MLRYVFDWMLVVSFLILSAAVIRLAGVRANYYQLKARDNKVLESRIPAARGDIVDRKGRVLALSVYQYFKVENGSKIFASDGDFQGYKFEGKDLAYELKRKYPYGESEGLITGYVGKAAESDINATGCSKTIDGNDWVGKMGMESKLDCNLRGVDGKRLIEVDAMGNYVRELGRAEPEKGENIKLSIDAFWQDRVYQTLKGQRAAVIMTDPKTGKIITLVTSPAMDPNNFSYVVDNRMITQYLNDGENLPLMNRTISAKYHSGSVFKPIMAVAGLESGVIDKNTLIEDTGIIKVGDYSYTNWLWTKRGTTDGMVNITKALQRSNDIYFYKLGERLGVDRIKEWATKFGLGQKSGIELPGELPGLVPDEAWKIATKGESWFLGNTYHLSIGQGDLSVTPLQINVMTQIVANRGLKCKTSILEDSGVECQKLDVSQSTWATVIEGMREACQPNGTAWPLFNFKTPIACKTGTAEVGDGSNASHAWLTAFAPIDNPQIVITVMIERGGEGSDVAAPIVGDILKEWFDEPNTLVPRHTPTPVPVR